MVLNKPLQLSSISSWLSGLVESVKSIPQSDSQHVPLLGDLLKE